MRKIYLHKDERIEGMLLINMLALLAYSLLERQARQNGWQMTTRRIIAKLDDLDVIETLCWDGSLLYRIVPLWTRNRRRYWRSWRKSWQISDALAGRTHCFLLATASLWPCHPLTTGTEAQRSKSPRRPFWREGRGVPGE